MAPINDNILLSICIPTYNRCELLSRSLVEVLEASRDFSDEVEVIVSDNCSPDATNAWVESLTGQYTNLRYFRNKTNEGANRNFYKLTDVYARGKYCWLLGDDDVILRSSFPQIINLLRSNEIDFMKLNFGLIPAETPVSDYKEQRSTPTDYSLNSFAEVVNADVSSPNILVTFISASIFRLKSFKAFEKPESYYENNWNSPEEVFSHSCIFTQIFSHNNHCVYFSNPALVAYVWQKDWDDKLVRLHTYIIPKLYNLYLKCGNPKSALRDTKELIIKNCIINLRHEKKMSRVLFALWFLIYNFLYVFKVCIKEIRKL
jgi:glycosyltransferase involved in cell wall biosynthesis